MRRSSGRYTTMHTRASVVLPGAVRLSQLLDPHVKAVCHPHRCNISANRITQLRTHNLLHNHGHDSKQTLPLAQFNRNVSACRERREHIHVHPREACGGHGQGACVYVAQVLLREGSEVRAAGHGAGHVAAAVRRPELASAGRVVHLHRDGAQARHFQGHVGTAARLQQSAPSEPRGTASLCSQLRLGCICLKHLCFQGFLQALFYGCSVHKKTVWHRSTGLWGGHMKSCWFMPSSSAATCEIVHQASAQVFLSLASGSAMWCLHAQLKPDFQDWDPSGAWCAAL